MTDQLGPASKPAEVEDAIIAALDRAGSSATEEFDFDEAVRRELAAIHSLVSPDEAEAAESAGNSELLEQIRWAFEYHVAFDGSDMSSRAKFQPWQHFADDSTYPPGLHEVSDDALDRWERIASGVTAAPVMARLEHLLFERRRGNGQARARVAAESYLQVTTDWTSRLDRVTTLRLALGLARATQLDDLAARVLTEIISTARVSLAAQDPEPGVALNLIELAALDRTPPPELDELLEVARATYTEPWHADDVIQLQIRRANGDEVATRALVESRVRNWISAAQAGPSIVRPIHMTKAIELARSAGRADLVEEATARLQETRFEDLGLKSIKTGVSVTRAAVDQALAPILNAASWSEALDVFAQFGPITGDVKRNREQVAEQTAAFPLSALFPHQRVGADGLPRFLASTDEENAEFALASLEDMYLKLGAHLIAEGLLRVMKTHGLPPETDLTAHFGRNPIIAPEVAGAIARAFLRFWAGDSEAAAYTIAPRIETLARGLLLDKNVGIYRTQRANRPGQYPGLGFLLTALLDEGMDASWQRLIYTLCANPAGINLRNEMLHGFVGDIGDVWAAVLLQSAAYLASLSVQTGAAADSPSGGE